jgi:hypothetical protein
MWGLGHAWEANASKLRRKTGLRVCKTCNRMLLGPIRGHLEGWRGPSSGSPVYEIFSRPERDLGPRTSRLNVGPRPCLGGQCKQVAAERGLRVCKTCNRMLLGPSRGHLEGWRGPSSGSPVHEIFSRPERDLGPRTSRLNVGPRPCLGGQCKQVAAENGATGVQKMQPNAFGSN